MSRLAKCILALLGAACVGAAHPQAGAGSLDGPEIADYRVWRSNRCYKPPPPPVRISDPLTYNLAVDAFNRYFDQMKVFMECVGAEANQDYEAMRKVLETGLGRARQDALEDLERSRAAIERYRGTYSGPALNAERPPRR